MRNIVKTLSEAADRYLENEDFQKTFCNGCPAITVRDASFFDPGDVTCPCDFDPSDEDCYRADIYEEIKSALMEADEIWRY
jgi:hypothetical protein